MILSQPARAAAPVAVEERVPEHARAHRALQEHYLTDVLAGAAVGTLVGWAVPHFFHAPREGGLELRSVPGGISIAW